MASGQPLFDFAQDQALIVASQVASRHHQWMIDTKPLQALLNQAFATHPMVSQADVAEACDVTPQAVSAWRKTGSVDKKHFPALSRVFDLPLDYWHGLSVREAATARLYAVRPVDADDGVDPERDVRIPEVDVHLAGGDGNNAIEFVTISKGLTFQIEWLRSVGVRDPTKAWLMRVTGDSMSGTINDSDVVLVHTSVDRINSDRVYAFLLDGEPRVKRLFNSVSGLRIVSDNADKAKYPDEFIPPDQLDRVHIIGRVIHRQGTKGL